MSKNDVFLLVGNEYPGGVGAGYISCSADNTDGGFRAHFNCPEGTQRFCGELSRIKMPRTSAFFFTRIQHDTTMGLPGYVLTCQDAITTGKKSTMSPKTILAISPDVEGMRKYWSLVHDMYFKHRPANIFDVHVKDHEVFGKGRIFFQSSFDGFADESKRRRSDTGAGTEILGFFTGKARAGYCIRCQPPPVPFDAFTAKNVFGVLPGPKYARLKAGEPVDSDEKRDETGSPIVVTLLDIQAASKAKGSANDISSIFLILDGDNLEDILSATGELFQNFPTSDVISGVQLLLPNVAINASTISVEDFGSRLGKLRNFSKTCEVVCSSQFADSPVFPTATIHRHHLSFLAPKCFIFNDDSKKNIWPYSSTWRISDGSKTNTDFSQPALKTSVELLSKGFQDSVRSHDIEHQCSNSSLLSENGFLFLGTGSAVPSKYRNVSGLVATHVSNENVCSVICDMGEGSMGQWSRFLKDAKQSDQLMEQVLAVRILFLSHTHADHVLGMFSFVAFLATASRGRSLSPLCILCPRTFKVFFELLAPIICPEFDRVQQAIRCVEIDSPNDTYSACAHYKQRVLSIDSFLKDAIGSSCRLSVIPVDHPAHAHALFFALEGWSWCYSGDTRPHQLLIETALSSQFAPLNVLVHECTFNDDLRDEAVVKRHSTLREALEVGSKCKAHHVLLNHFSQRYPKIPPAASQSKGEVPFSFSFDGLWVSNTTLSDGYMERHQSRFSALLLEYDSWSESTTSRMKSNSN